MPNSVFYNLDKDKKERILRAAMAEFASNPYRNVSLMNIAEKAEIKRTALYYYFQGKEDIYYYLIDSFEQQFISSQADAVRNKDIFQLFEALFLHIVNIQDRLELDFICQTFKYFNSQDKDGLDSIFQYAVNIAKKEDKSGFFKLLQQTDFSEIKLKGEEYLKALSYMLLSATSHILIRFNEENMSVDEAHTLYMRLLEILKYGALKQ